MALMVYFFTHFPRILLIFKLFLSSLNVYIFGGGSNISDWEDYYGNSWPGIS